MSQTKFLQLPHFSNFVYGGDSGGGSGDGSGGDSGDGDGGDGSVWWCVVVCGV